MKMIYIKWWKGRNTEEITALSRTRSGRDYGGGAGGGSGIGSGLGAGGGSSGLGSALAVSCYVNFQEKKKTFL
jgi:hypothetical protein